MISNDIINYNQFLAESLTGEYEVKTSKKIRIQKSAVNN